MTAKIILAICEILGAIAVGALMRGLGYIKPQEIDRFSKITIDFLLTGLIFASIINNFDTERLSELWILPLMGFGMMAAGGLLGFLFRMPIINHDVDMVKTFHHFCAINNYVFLPLVIIQNIWGERAVAELFLFNLGSTVGFWTVGVALLSDLNHLGRSADGADKNVRQKLRAWLGNLSHLLTPSLIALILAVIISLVGMADRVPSVVMKVSSRLGAAAVPCMLLLVGATMYPLPKIKSRAVLGYISLLRLIVIPAILVTVISLLELPENVRNLSYIVAIMPASISSAVITRRYGGDPQFASAAAMVTTLLAAITAPIWLIIMQKLSLLSG